MAMPPAPPEMSLTDMPWFVIYMVIMVTLSQLLLLVLVLVLAYKMNRLVAKLGRISQDAGKFVQMGMTFFKKR
jgi:hypothetical protein